MLALQARIVIDRARKARADRLAAETHGTGDNADFYRRRAAFWQDAADRAAKGDLSPVTFRDAETDAEDLAEGVRLILVRVG